MVCDDCEEREKLKNNLKTLPKKILDMEKKVIEKKEKRQELQLINKTIEISMAYEVESEKDSENKKKYSNNTQRDAETQKRLGNDIEYQKNIKTIKDMGRNIAEEEAFLSYLKRAFISAESITRL